MGYTGEQKREYQRKWIAARKEKWFSGKSCVVCGAVENLELDHVDPATKVTHRIWSYSWEKIEQETEKCQVLCYEHHKQKTLNNKECLRGEAHPKSTHTEEQVLEARMLRNSGLSYQEIADSLGIPFKMGVWNLINKHWQHL